MEAVGSTETVVNTATIASEGGGSWFLQNMYYTV
jgi:hypothetical protein